MEMSVGLRNAKSRLVYSNFEKLRMGENETIDSYTSRLFDLVNEAHSLGCPMSNEALVNKVLRSLPKKFNMKVAIIEEVKDTSTLSIHELICNLRTYEMVVAQQKLDHGKSNPKPDMNGKGKPRNEPNNIDSIRCRVCTGFGHYAYECANVIKRLGVSLHVALSDDDESE